MGEHLTEAEAIQRVSAVKAVAAALYAAGANPHDGVSYADLAEAAIETLARFDRVIERMTTAPEARLANVWDEGYNAGFDNGVDAAQRRPTTRHDNPHRPAPITGADDA